MRLRQTWAMTRDDVLAICLDVPAAEETYPFGDEVAVMKVGGKMFALVPLSEEPGSVNLKCDPARALELREAYSGIRPGYHQNKRHWNTVDLDGSVEDDVVYGLIADSYDMVVGGSAPLDPRGGDPGLSVDGSGGKSHPEERTTRGSGNRLAESAPARP